MAVLETNYIEMEIEKRYKKPEIKPDRFEVPNNLVDVLEALSGYCDERTVPYSNGCFNCPFYIEDETCSCLIAKSGFNSPYNWAVYKDEGAGDKNT